MKLTNLIEELVLEANRQDTLVNKLGLSQDNAEALEQLAGPFSIIIGNKLIEVFAEESLERLSSSLPEEEEKRIREIFSTDPQYRKEMGIEAINKSFGVRNVRHQIVSIMDWVRVGLNGNLGEYKNLNFNELYSESRKWHQELTSGEGDINYTETNEIVKDYRDENGIGFYWVNLNTNDSREECNRMGHCGRTNSNNSVYSFRETKKLKDNYTINKSHLTAAIENGTGIMYQLKGPKNSKPKEIYHPYIVDLILNTNIINGFGSEYDASTDFSINDLSDDQIVKIYQAKPEIFNMYKLKRKLKELGLIDELALRNVIFNYNFEPEYVSGLVDGDWVVHTRKNIYGGVDKVYFIEHLLSDDFFSDLDYFDNDWESSLEYYVNDYNEQTIIDYLKNKAGADYDPDMSTKDLIQKYDDDDEIKDRINYTYSDLANSSYYDYAIKQLKNALSEYGEVLKLDNTGATIKIDLNDITKNLSDSQIFMNWFISDELYEKCDEDAECIFNEILRDYYEKPRFYLDDRWSPDIDEKEYNDYLTDSLSEL